MNAFNNLNVDRFSRNLIVDEEDLLFLGRQLSNCLDPHAAGNVDGNRFCHVDVSAGIDGRTGVTGKERGRSLQDHGFNAAVEHPFVAGQPGETPRFVDAQCSTCLAGGFRKVVGHCAKLVSTLSEHMAGQPASSFAAADQPHLDLGAGSLAGGLLLLAPMTGLGPPLRSEAVAAAPMAPARNCRRECLSRSVDRVGPLICGMIEPYHRVCGIRSGDDPTEEPARSVGSRLCGSRPLPRLSAGVYRRTRRRALRKQAIASPIPSRSTSIEGSGTSVDSASAW